MLDATFAAVLALSTPATQAAVTSESVLTEAGRQEIVRTLTRLEAEWIQVYQTHELGVLERIIAEDFVATLADGTMRGKKEHIAAYPQDFADYSAVTGGEVKVHVYSPEAAVVTGMYTAKRKPPGGAETSERYRWTDTWLRRKGAWQCVATQETQVE